MQIIETDDAGIRAAALEIIRSHRPEAIAVIMQSAEPRIARAIAALLARSSAPPPPPRRQVGTLGRRSRRPKGL